MLTPQEVSERAFPKAGFGGYNMAMVDEFLDTLTEDYTALYKENAALKAKMKVLADKVEEYRSTEDAMRKALLAAQSMAEEMVKDAEKKKAELLTQAEIEAKDRIAALHQEVANEEARLTAAKNATTVCVAKVRELYQRELAYLESLDSLTVSTPPAAQPEPDPVAVAVAEIESNMNRIVEEQDEEDDEDTKELEAVPPTPQAKDDEEAGPARRIDLDDLQFGKDFELK